MDKEWIEARKAEAREKFEKERQRIKKEITEFGKFFPDMEKTILQNIDSLQYDDEQLWYKMNDLETDLRFSWRSTNIDEIDLYLEWVKKLDFDKFRACCSNYERYADGELIEFDGDIIITDPCYIVKERDESDRPKWGDFHPYESIYEYPDYNEETKLSEMFRKNADALSKADREWKRKHPDDWDVCGCGSNMESLGVQKYMTRDTLYGDWSCTTFDTDTGEPIGEFCADAGLVSVFDLAEVLAYNPDFDYHTERKWTTTLIKDFKGTVQFVVKHIEGVYEDDTKWWSKGEKWEDYVVEVVGHGINKITGRPINFVGKQTGF